MMMASQSPFQPPQSASYAQPMTPGGYDGAGYNITAPQLSPTISSFFGSVKHNGRFSVPREVHLTAAFGELKLDLREALFPEKHVLFVANTFCGSLEVLLPEGVTVVDQSTVAFGSQSVNQDAEEHGPVIHLEGFTLFGDVKFIAR